MLVRDLMTKSPICCKPGDTLDRVARLMRDQDCGVVPVCDGTKLVGVITDRDVTCRGVAGGKVPAAVAAGDLMVELANTLPGLIGARLTGGGFGGCTVNLVENDHAAAFAASLKAAYLKESGITADVYLCHASAAAGLVSTA